MPVSGITKESPEQMKKAVKEALDRQDGVCEFGADHGSFFEKDGERPFLHADMLIPITAQKDFNNSLQVAANYRCLCPTCHDKLISEKDAKRQEMLSQLYLGHKDALKEAGIEVTPLQLFKYYGMK